MYRFILNTPPFIAAAPKQPAPTPPLLPCQPQAFGAVFQAYECFAHLELQSVRIVLINHHWFVQQQ